MKRGLRQGLDLGGGSGRSRGKEFQLSQLGPRFFWILPECAHTHLKEEFRPASRLCWSAEG